MRTHRLHFYEDDDDDKIVEGYELRAREEVLPRCIGNSHHAALLDLSVQLCVCGERDV